MLKLILATVVALALFAVATPVSAAVISCSTALEAEGHCVAGQHLLILVAASTEDLTRLAAAEAERINYQATVPCGEERAVDDAGVLVIAGPEDTGCSADNRGQTIANPQPAADAVSSVLAATLRQRTVEAERRERQEEVPSPAPPDIRPDNRGGGGG